jgi:hypothetical protein
MTKLVQIPSVIAVDPKFVSRIRRWKVFSAKLIFWPLALLTLVALALQLGAWKKEFKTTGPFAAETNPARHSLILAVPQEAPATWWRQPLIGDNGEKPLESFLELQIDGRAMGPPHSQHETIREAATSGFSHWGAFVIFSLPPDVKNVPETIARFFYDRRLRSLARRLRALLLLAGLYAERPIAVVLRIPYLILLGLCCIGLIGSTAYVACSLYALATGWALPTTALIHWSPAAQWAARNEPYIGYLLLMLAGFGTSVTWLAGSNAQLRWSVESNELSLRRLLFRCGFPIAACAFVFCISAMWAGIVRPGDPNFVNIGGLVPFSDAANYLSGAYDQVKDGSWGAVASHRPLAAALRSLLLFFGNYSLQIMLILQCCLLAAAACFAAHAVVMWRGIWAGIAFFGLTCIYDRAFVPTTLTEPLGLFWALLSIPFFIEAFASGSVRPALVAFAMTTIALMTRMGSMLTIPALLLWLVWQFGKGGGAKLRIGVIAIGTLLAILGLNTALQKAYGTRESSTGSNFAYTLCGVTIGTNWRGCPAKLAAEGEPLHGSEADRTKQLYSFALKNFRSQPRIFWKRLVDGAQTFVAEFPDAIWNGYQTAIQEPSWLWRNLLTAITLAGLLSIAMRRARAVELRFWMLLWASFLASSSIIYFDDGARVLAASHPLIALFFAMGMGSHGFPPNEAPFALMVGALRMARPSYRSGAIRLRSVDDPSLLSYKGHGRR